MNAERPARNSQPERHRQRSRIRSAAAVGAVVVAIDQLTKALVLAQIGPDEAVRLPFGIRLVRAFNTGGAFSLGKGDGSFKVVVFVVAAVLVLVARRELRRDPLDPHAPGPLAVVAFGLVVGGALGNLIDRAFRGGTGFGNGAVVDFVDVGWWPVFNVADSALSVGCVLLAVWSFRSGSGHRSGGEPGGQPADSEREAAVDGR